MQEEESGGGMEPMSDKELCGAETNKGTKCQNRAETCPWHNGDAPETGRPSKFEDARDDMIQAAREGLTMGGIARAGGVSETTLYEWLNKKEEFSERLNRARSKAERRLVKEVIEGEDRDPKFILGTSFGYNKRQELDVDMEHGGSVGITFNEAVIRKDDEDENDEDS